MDKRRREHPASLPPHISYYLLFLLIPLIRGVTEAVLTAAGLLFYWILHRLRYFYTITPRGIILERGILLRRTVHIPLSGITTLTITRPLWLRLLRAAHILVDTDGGTRWAADARLTVPNRCARLFLPDSEGGTLWRPRQRRLCLLAVLSSDSFGGVLLLSAVLRQSSILLGEGIQQTVLNNLEAAADMLTIIPRTAALLILILLCGWLVGALRHLLRHLPFAVHRGEQTLTIYSGWLTRRIHCCSVDAIHYTDIRQTLTACLCRRHTVYISCTGYGKDKHTLAILLPPGTRKQTREELTAMLPSLTPAEMRLRPCRGALWRYIWLPLTLLALLPLCGWGAGLLFPLWRGLILYLTLMGLFPCLWLLAVGIIHRYRAGIGYADGRYTLCYARRLTLHRVTLPRHKVAAVRVRQSPWQQWRGRCDLTLYSYHESRRPHRVRHLSIQEIRTLFPIKEV